MVGRITEFIISDAVIAMKYGRTEYNFFARSLKRRCLSDVKMTKEVVTTELLWAIRRKKIKLDRLCV